MADISQIKLPSGTTYNIKDSISGYTTNTGTITKVQTTAGAHSTINVSSGAATFNVPTKTSHLTNDSGFITDAGVTGVKGNAENSYRTGQVNLTAENIGAVPYDGALFTTNTFTSEKLRKLYISKIDNAFYALDKRFDVTVIYDNNIVSNVSQFFDGNYEGNNLYIENGKTAIFTLDFSSASGSKFPGYPYGYIYISFYNYCIPGTITGRVYNNYASQGVGWKDITFTQFDRGIFRARQDYYGLQTLEITIIGSDDTPYGYTSPTEIEMQIDRPDPVVHNSMVSKFAAQTLYYDLTAPNFRGNLTGNVTGNVSGSAGSVAWSGVGSKPTTLSGYGITDAKIASGTITLGSDTITPLTSSSTLNAAKLSGAIPSAVTATTQSAGDNSTKIATTAFVSSAISSLGSVLNYKGTKAAVSNLPTSSNQIGDVWHVTATSGEYAWDGTAWQELGSTIDLSGYATHGNTGSSTTGITASTTATKTTLGTAFTIPNVTSAGSASSWTFEEKTIPNVTAAGSGSASLTFTMDTTDTKKLKITFSHTHTAPTIGTAIKVQSKSGGSNGTAPTLGTAFTVPNVTGNTSATVSITDNGHTHTI